MSSETMAVSVVIPVLNGAATIGSVLTALEAQAGAPTPREVIVVDNGSTDGTAEVVARHAVTFLHEPRRGASSARNLGLREARGELVAFIDSDGVPTRRWLAELLAPFDDPAVLIVGGQVGSLPPTTPAQRFAAQYGMQRTWVLRSGQFAAPSSGNLAVRRAAALEIGGFDPEMLTAEDSDFTFRLHARFGVDVVYQPRAMTMHRDRATDEELRVQAAGYGRGLADMYRRYPERMPWGWRQRAAVAMRLSGRISREMAARAALRLGRSTPAEAEFAIYARRWNWWFWGAFWQRSRQSSRQSPGRR